MLKPISTLITFSSWIMLLLSVVYSQFTEVIAQNRTTLVLQHAGSTEVGHRIQQTATNLLTAINEAYFENKEPEFGDNWITEEGKSYLRTLWGAAPFYCPDTELVTPLIQRSHLNGYEVRGVRLFIKANDTQTQSEEGILLFTDDGRLDQLRFGVEEHLYQYVIDADAAGAEFIHRQIILDFVEKYRTAYNLRDLPFIRDVFSENALIIIGKVVEVENPSEMEHVLEEKTMELVRYSKDEYLDRLASVFEKNEFLEVGYDSLEVYRHPRFPEIYGVTLLQHWNSSSYSDRGYLFLMIDFRDENKPIIHVRTWQLMKYTTRDEVIGLGDFPIF